MAFDVCCRKNSNAVITSFCASFGCIYSSSERLKELENFSNLYNLVLLNLGLINTFFFIYTIKFIFKFSCVFITKSRFPGLKSMLMMSPFQMPWKANPNLKSDQILFFFAYILQSLGSKSIPIPVGWKKTSLSRKK